MDISVILSLVIMAICIVVFVIDKVPTSVVAILGCAAMAIFVPKVSSATAFSGFSNDIILLLIGMFIVSDALLGSGAASIIGNFVLKLAKGHEKLLVAILTFTTILLSAFIGNSATVPMMLTVVYGIVVADKENKYNFMHLALPVGMGGVLGGSTTLIASTPQLVAQSSLAEIVKTYGLSGLTYKWGIFNYSYSIGMFTFSLPGFLIAIIGALFVIFVGYPLGKKIWGKRDPIAAKAKIVAPENLDFKDKGNRYRLIMSFAIVIFMIIMLIVTAFIGNINLVFNGKYSLGLTIGNISMICGALCILLKVTTFERAYKTLNWNVVLWLAGCIGLGAALSASGAGQWIADSLVNVMKDMPHIVFFAIVVLLAIVMSNFMANLTTVLILATTVVPAGVQMGMNPLCLMIGIVFAANFALLTPLANAFIGLTQTAGYKFSDYIKYGIAPQILVTLLIIVFVPLFFGLDLSAEHYQIVQEAISAVV